MNSSMLIRETTSGSPTHLSPTSAEPSRVLSRKAPNQPDELFSQKQFDRLQELQQSQRACHQRGLEMPTEVWRELEALIEEEVNAACTRVERYLARTS